MSGEKKHVVRFVHPNIWLCSCGAWLQTDGHRAVGLAQEAAEQHAFENRGSIEMGRAS